jgi:hypothetical protein
MGRLRGPFGHLWLLSQRLEELSVSDIQRRRDAWAPPETVSKMLASLPVVRHLSKRRRAKGAAAGPQGGFI